LVSPSSAYIRSHIEGGSLCGDFSFVYVIDFGRSAAAAGRIIGHLPM
jgi:hypothetical protein